MMRDLAIALCLAVVAVGCLLDASAVETPRTDGRIEACLSAMSDGNARVDASCYRRNLYEGITSIQDLSDRAQAVKDVAARILAADLRVRDEDYAKYEREVGRYWQCATVVRRIMFEDLKDEEAGLEFYVASWRKFKRLSFAIPLDAQREDEPDRAFSRRRTSASNLWVGYEDATNYWRYMTDGRCRAALTPSVRSEVMRWNEEFGKFPSREELNGSLRFRDRCMRKRSAQLQKTMPSVS